MEKCQYPRVARQFSAVIENAEGTHLNVVAVDTSSEGLSILCNTLVRNLITPGGCFIGEDGKPVELLVWLKLPVGGGKARQIGARCHVSFSRRISSQQCKIGMRFMDLEQGGYTTLVKYIESAILSDQQSAGLTEKKLNYI